MQGDTGLALAGGDTVLASPPTGSEIIISVGGGCLKSQGSAWGEQEDRAGASLAPRGVPRGDVPPAWPIGQVGTWGTGPWKTAPAHVPGQNTALCCPCHGPGLGAASPPVGHWGPPTAQCVGNRLPCRWVPRGGGGHTGTGAMGLGGGG